MSTPVAADRIESIVGVTRHPTRHYGRAVSAEQRVYVLHSAACLDTHAETGTPLTECRYSLALDRGIDLDVWPEDVAVPLTIAGDGRLVPTGAAPPPPCCQDRPDVPRMHVHPQVRPLPSCCAAAAVLPLDGPPPEPRHNRLAANCRHRDSATIPGNRCATCAAAVAHLDPDLVTTLRHATDRWGPMGVALALLDLVPPLRESLRIRLNSEAAPGPAPTSDAAAADPLADYRDRP